MFFRRAEPPLAPQPLEPRVAELEGQVKNLQRAIKLLETDADTWIGKYRALAIRTERAAARVEREPPQEPLGTTIDHPEGVTPPQGKRDPWMSLASARRARGA